VQFRQFQFGCFRLEGEVALHLKLTRFREGQTLQGNRLCSALGTRGQLECERAVERPMTAAVPVRDVTDLRSDETEVAGVATREALGVVAEQHVPARHTLREVIEEEDPRKRVVLAKAGVRSQDGSL